MASSARGNGRNRPRTTSRPGAGRTRPSSRRRGAGRTPATAGPSAGAGSRSDGSGHTGGPGDHRGGGPAGRRPRLTGRSLIVLVVLAVLFVSYATSLRAFLDQRDHIDELQSQIARDRRAVAELREERGRWQDEAFIEAQARERFGWVMPGEVGLRVLGEDGEPLDAGAELTDPASMGADPDAEWWTATWASIKRAGARPDAGPGPVARLGPPPNARERGRRDGNGRGR